LNAAATLAHSGYAPQPKLSAGIVSIQLAMLWLVGLSGSFVKFEPAPYDGLVGLAALFFIITGLKIKPGHMPLIFLMIGTSIAYGIGVIPVIDREGTLQWSAVSTFLALSSVFFAMALAEDTERRLNILIAGYTASAFLAAIFAILTWFHAIPGSDNFLMGGRAKGFFKDPNVFGPFLILPAIVMISRILSGRYRSLLFNLALLGPILLAILFSFSRGAWGHFAASTLLMVILTFFTVQTNKERLRIIFFAALGVVAVTLLLGAILSIGSVGSLFQERASLVQSYDSAPQGRFARYAPGFLLMLDNPIGIGPLQFTQYFPEDPHNSFLDAFVAGGWLGGAVHFTLMIVTLIMGLRHVFVRSPWQKTYIAVYATFAAEVGESVIIDVQHWRHFYLLIGLVWGLMAVGRGVAPAAAAPYNRPSRSVAQPG
jgi:hypothetical protein